MFSGDLFIPTDDPFGRHGPRLDEILKISSNLNDINIKRPKTTANAVNKQKEKQERNRDVRRKSKSPAARNSPEDNLKKENTKTQQKHKNLQNLNTHATASQASGTIDDSNNKMRSILETNEISIKLNQLFPSSGSKIAQLLNKYPDVRDMHFFGDKLIQLK